MPKGKRLLAIACVAFGIAFLVRSTRHQPVFPAIATICLWMVLWVVLLGSRAATRVVIENKSSIRWIGWAVIAAGVVSVPLGLAWDSAWMLAADNGSLPPILIGLLCVSPTGLVILGLPSATAAVLCERMPEAPPTRPRQFAGLHECAASVRFVADNPKPLARLAGPWIVMSWGIPWLVYEALQPHWRHLRELEQAGIPTGPPYAPPPILVAAALFILLATVAIPAFAVNWHRFIAGCRVTGVGALFPGRRAFAYLWRLWAAQSGAGALTGLLDSNAQDVAGFIGLSDPWPIILVIDLALLCLGVWIESGSALVLPAIALQEQPPSVIDLVRVAKTLGTGFPLGLCIVVVLWQLGALAALGGLAWILGRDNPTAVVIACIFVFTLGFAMTAIVATFLSRAYEIAMRPSETSGAV